MNSDDISRLSSVAKNLCENPKNFEQIIYMEAGSAISRDLLLSLSILKGQIISAKMYSLPVLASIGGRLVYGETEIGKSIGRVLLWNIRRFLYRKMKRCRTLTDLELDSMHRIINAINSIQEE